MCLKIWWVVRRGISLWYHSQQQKQTAMTAQEIFNEKGFKTSDNRSLEWRNINKAISFGIGVQPVEAGCYRKTKNGLGYRIRLSFGDRGVVYEAPNLKHYNDSSIVSSCVINCIVDFRAILEREGLFQKAIAIAEEKGTPICTKCKGKGIIPPFMHYCKGVCFDCMGLGYGKQGLIKVL